MIDLDFFDGAAPKQLSPGNLLADESIDMARNKEPPRRACATVNSDDSCVLRLRNEDMQALMQKDEEIRSVVEAAGNHRKLARSQEHNASHACGNGDALNGHAGELSSGGMMNDKEEIADTVNKLQEHGGGQKEEEEEDGREALDVSDKALPLLDSASLHGHHRKRPS